MRKLQDASCAICMDALFDLRDDLDEELHVAAPDCGHVFHEKCLLEWFKSQADQFIARAREYRTQDITAADAPAECPQCRAECFADPESGEPALHRLFITWGEEEAMASQMPGSSPQRATPQRSWHRPAEQELLHLARRARNLGAEVAAYGAESGADDVAGTLRRAESLRAEAADSKAAKGFKAYVGGLTRALHELNARLESHPLIATLQSRMEADAARLRERDAELARMQREVLPREISAAVKAETARMERRVRAAQGERELMQRDLAREQVAHRAFRRAAGEREAALEARLADERRKLELEKADAEETRRRLDERGKQVQILRSRVESRKALKARLAELEAENRALKGGSAPPAKEGAEREDREREEREREERDTEEREREEAGAASEPESPPLADSLVVDLPPLPSLGSSPPPARRSTTARTFTYGPAGRSKAENNRPSRKKSKYFASPSPTRRVLVADSSPLKHSPQPRARGHSPLKPAHTLRAPPLSEKFTASITRHSESRKRPPEPEPEPEPEVISLLDSSPPPRAVQRTRSAPSGGIVDFLTDRHGRPRKTLALGPKFRRRA